MGPPYVPVELCLYPNAAKVRSPMKRAGGVVCPEIARNNGRAG